MAIALEAQAKIFGASIESVAIALAVVGVFEWELPIAQAIALAPVRQITSTLTAVEYP